MKYSPVPRYQEPIGIDALFDIERLPVLRSGRAGLISSYNRNSYNFDLTPEALGWVKRNAVSKNLCFYTWDKQAHVDDLMVSANCEAGQWRHIAVTWQLSSNQQFTKRVYVDGKMAAERRIDNWIPMQYRDAYPSDVNSQLMVGSQVGTWWLRGALSDVVICDRACASGEIAALMKHTGQHNSDTLTTHVCASGERSAVKPLKKPAHPRPFGDGIKLSEKENLVYPSSGLMSSSEGTFAAWINPTELTNKQLQHIFCLGGDFMGLYLVPSLSGLEAIIGELKGPGCIYRVWVGGGAGPTFRFYFDGEKNPRLSLRFSGTHGEPQLGAAKWLPLTSSGGELSYPPMMASGNGLETGISFMPMPFAKSCRVTIEPADGKFFQINYSLYPPTTKLVTYDPNHINAVDVQTIKAGRERWNHPQPCRAAHSLKVKDIKNTLHLAPGQKQPFAELSGAGRVTAIYLKLPEAQRVESVLRGLQMRVFWDGSVSPAIDTAIGPFFNDIYGTPSRLKPVPLSKDISAVVPDEREQMQWRYGLPYEYRNQLFGYTRSGGYYCYFPMPFGDGCRVEFQNNCSEPVSMVVVLHAEEWAEMPGNMGRFHAVSHRENPTEGIDDPSKLHTDHTGVNNYLMMSTHGRGHYVGCGYSFRKVRQIPQAVEALVYDMCEGNDMIFVDDDPTASLIGTGGEDFANQNYWVHDHIYPYDGNRLSYDMVYRLQISDCVPFYNNIRVTAEHGAGNAHYLDYSSAAYWYEQAR